ncbi:LiaI-LiaF-like domain-containing protein [Chloroflexota bacterium]
MSEKKPQRIVGVPIWGIFLLFLGIVFLLQTLEVLPWGLWGTLWRFWPALIIIIGLGILLRGYNIWLVSLLVLAIFGACLGIAICQYEASTPPGMVTKSYSEPLGDIERGQIEIDFTAGSITMGSLPPTSPNFVEAGSRIRNGHKPMNVDFHQEDGEGKLYLSTANQRFLGEDGIKWEVRFAQNIPLAINIKSAVSNMELDLSELKVTEFRLDVDAGNCEVTMPSSAGTTHAYIKTDVANVEVAIPDEVAARIQVDIDLSVFDIDESRFSQQGDYYMSQDFDSAENRIELEIDCDVGRVRVR